MDFSLANLTFNDFKCLHSVKPDKPNDYRDIIALLCTSFNIAEIPIWGYSANTLPKRSKNASLFPLNKNIKNPYVSNSRLHIHETYTSCLKDIELSLPVNLGPLLSMYRDFAKKARIEGGC